MSSHLMFSPLPTPAEMAAWDKTAIATFGIPEFTLMENASREALHVMTVLTPKRTSILVIMGGGNNGGDGAALARHLFDIGHDVLVCHTKALEDLPETSRQHALLARQTGVPFIPAKLHEGRLVVPSRHRQIASSPRIVIDALLGSGFTGTLRETEFQLVEHMNTLGESALIVSLDIPSGLDGTFGIPRPVAVRADHTITFESAKTGLAIPHARPYTGCLHVRPIGIPAAARQSTPASFRLLAPQRGAWPVPHSTMHKGNAGRVVIIGGSKAFPGAPVLAALGALRAGAGLVTMVCPGGLCSTLRAGFPEIMTHPLPGEVGEEDWRENMIPSLLDLLSLLPRASCVILGPGLGRSSAINKIVTAILKHEGRPDIVLDADGLYPLGADAHGVLSPLLKLLRDDDCITPHPGEAARILGTVTEDIQAARVESFHALTDASKAVIVLKGAGTLIGQGKSPITIAPFATPALAVGGSGDVLSGVIAAHMARARLFCLPPHSCDSTLMAACLGVHLHGRAGEILEERFPGRGALAREIADAIPLAYPGTNDDSL